MPQNENTQVQVFRDYKSIFQMNFEAENGLKNYIGALENGTEIVLGGPLLIPGSEDYFLIERPDLQVDSDTYVWAINYVHFSNLYMETFYVRLLPVGGPGELRFLADEVMRVIPAVLAKEQVEVNRPLLKKYLGMWKTNEHRHRTINLDEFNEALDAFEVNKSRITVVPDLAVAAYTRKTLLPPLALVLTDGTKAISPGKAALITFRELGCKVNHVNWKSSCCMERTGERMKELLRMYQAERKTVLLSMAFVKSEIVKIWRLMCQKCDKLMSLLPQYPYCPKNVLENLAIEDYQRVCKAKKIPVFAHTLADRIPVWMARLYLNGGWLQMSCVKDDDNLRMYLVEQIEERQVPVGEKDNEQMKIFLNYIALNTKESKIKFTTYIKKQKRIHKRLAEQQPSLQADIALDIILKVWDSIKAAGISGEFEKTVDELVTLARDRIGSPKSEKSSQQEYRDEVLKILCKNEDFYKYYCDMKNNESMNSDSIGEVQLQTLINEYFRIMQLEQDDVSEQKGTENCLESEEEDQSKYKNPNCVYKPPTEVTPNTYSSLELPTFFDAEAPVTKVTTGHLSTNDNILNGTSDSEPCSTAPVTQETEVETATATPVEKPDYSLLELLACNKNRYKLAETLLKTFEEEVKLLKEEKNREGMEKEEEDDEDMENRVFANVIQKLEDPDKKFLMDLLAITGLQSDMERSEAQNTDLEVDPSLMALLALRDQKVEELNQNLFNNIQDVENEQSEENEQAEKNEQAELHTPTENRPLEVALLRKRILKLEKSLQKETEEKKTLKEELADLHREYSVVKELNKEISERILELIKGKF